ncbi:MAG: pyridoxamine 5'-phosphate oxidase family protein [Candidatus Fimisoma sp.]|nr:pyridoxamine 5'-phosphate oxidase family protein [Candidatus Fimisoma sp.]
MFRELRRKKQLLSEQETLRVLEEGKTGIVGVLGDDGYPYTVPINYVSLEDKIYFHSAKKGHKVDAIAKEPKVSMTVVEKDDVVSREFTTYFRSIQLFGKAYVVEDEAERNVAFRALCEKFSGADLDRYEEIMSKEAAAAAIVRIDIEHITGKESMELVNQR